MKIKTKKQLNLPQLIEWAWENDVRNKGFESERTSRAYFDYDGYLSCTRAVERTDIFTVEVEEEITEDTPFKKLFLLTNDSVYSEMYYNYSINDVLSDNEGYYQELAILIMYPEPKIIWTPDKGLVE